MDVPKTKGTPPVKQLKQAMKSFDAGVCIEKPPTPGLSGRMAPTLSIASPGAT